MIERILHKDVQEYIDTNLKSDIHKLILKGSPFPEITVQELANQIVSKQKCEKKLPIWFNSKNIYYPPKLNLEQTSSEVTANYKSSLVSGESIIDLTGGFGVDSYYFSKRFSSVIYCEINSELSEIASHNFTALEVTNIQAISENGIEYLQNTKEVFDCIYIDPSRRNDAKGKVFLLEDCEPNVPENIELLFKKSKTVLLKVSPILDITSAINELNFVKEIHVVALNNDVKELLFLLEKDYASEIEIKTTNFSKKEVIKFSFTYNSEIVSKYNLPLKYLYEPNAAILKSGGFHQITSKFDVCKLHQHSHLYTSNGLISFPGRSFKINAIMSYDKKKIRKVIKDGKANITTRNFPKTVVLIRKELKLKDGGTSYLFFTTNLNNELICILCQKA